jgi:hypothetical protein
MTFLFAWMLLDMLEREIEADMAITGDQELGEQK